jgi:amidase
MTEPHPSTAALAYATATELLDQLAAGTTTSEAVVTALLERIAVLDGPGAVGLSAIAGLSADALAVARERDDERARGELRGPLHGLPVLIKDNIEAEGLPGVAGATALVGRPARDAELVTRLREAGAVILGSTNLSQWANLRSTKSASGYSATGGLVGNPWALERSAGGSSSGSGAAAAAGYAPLVVGTETDGSITCPASLNGVVGLKPTVGSVSRQGVVPISSRQDSPGPLTRSVADAALLFATLAGSPAPAERPSVSMVVSSTWRTGHPATDALFEEVIADLRATDVTLPDRTFGVPSIQEGNDELHALLCEFADELSAYLADRPGDGVRSMQDVVDFENAHADVEHRYSTHQHFLAALATGGTANAEYVERRDRVTNWSVRDCLEKGLGGDDVVLAPAYAPAWKSDLVLGDPGAWYSPGISVAAVAGWPIATVPMGLVEGLPVGLTLIGKPHAEWQLLEAARQVEAVVAARGWTPRPTFRQPQRG